MKNPFANTFFRDGAIAGVANLLTNVGSFVFYSAAAHALGPSTGGLFLALVAAALLTSMLANIAGVALTPEIARFRAADDRGGVRAHATRAALGWLGSSFVLGLLALALARPGEALFHLDDPLLLLETAAVVSANALLFLTRAFVQAIARFDVYAASNLIETGLKFASAFMILRSPSLRLTIGVLAGVLAFAAVATAWPIVAYVRRAVGAARLSRDERNAAGSLIAAFSALAVMTFADGIIARNLLPPFDAGLYNAAALAGRALMSALSFVPLVVLAKMPLAKGADRGDRMFYAAVVACCLAAIAIFARFPAFILIAVGGQAFLTGAPLVALYGIAASALAMSNLVVSYRLSRGARTIGRVLVAIAAAEVVAMLVYHPNAVALVTVLIAGHSAAFIASCITGSRVQFARSSRERQTGESSLGSSIT